MEHEPDMFASAEADVDLDYAKADLKSLTDDQFEDRYKVTKRLYVALIRSFPVLTELREALSEPNPMEIDSDLEDGIRFTIVDLAELVEQMRMASYWEQEQQ